MGEGDAVPDKPETVANGNVEVEEKIEAVIEKKEEQPNGVTEMEEDKKDDGKVEAQDTEVDREEVNKSEEIEEKVKDETVAMEGKTDEGKEETKEEEKQEIAEEGKVETKSEELENDSAENTKEIEYKVGAELDGVKEEDREPTVEKGPKKRPRTKSSASKKDKSKKKEAEDKEEKEIKTPNDKKTKKPKISIEKKKEPKTPVVSTIERPVRERKSVERLVAIIEKDAAKEFHVEKGRGTALKDIPNVAYKLSRKKTDDTFKLLHTILFGRRGKAAQVKNNISRFSGFVWQDNEEKQTIKVKEKLDKIVKEKLVEFCDVLDIPITKANTRKEDIIAKLIEFLVAPHATTTELLAEKDQSSKGKKRKRVNKSASGSSSPTKGSAKTQKKTESATKKGKETKSPPESEDESEDDKEEAHEEEDINGVTERSEDEMSEKAESEEKASESDEDKGKQKRGLAKSSAKKGSTEKAKTKKLTISKKASPPPKKAPVKSPPSRSKNNKDTSAKRSSGKKKDESIKERTSTPKKTAPGVSTGKKVLKVKDKPKEEKLKPSDDELRNAICEILKEVDFNTATFTDILKLLAKRFNGDLTPRKSSIKLMIQDELTKLADADEANDEEDEGDAVKDEKKISSLSVKA